MKSLQYIQLIGLVLGSLKKPTRNKGQIIRGLAHLANKLPQEEIVGLLDTALRYKSIREALNYEGLHRDEERLRVYNEDFPLRFSLQVIANSILRNAEEMKVFLNLESKLNHAFLYGKYEIAKAILTEANDKFGNSIWHFEMTMAYFSLTRDKDGLNAYLKTRQNSPVKHILNLLAEQFGKDKEFYKEKVVGSVISTYRNNKMNHYADMLNIALLPTSDLYDFDLSQALSNCLLFCPVDRFHHFRKALSFKISSEDVDDKELVLTSLKSIEAAIDSTSITKLIELLSGHFNTMEHVTSDSIFINYKKGRYLEVVEECNQRIKAETFDFCFLEMFSRSIAYSGETLNSDEDDEASKQEGESSVGHQSVAESMPTLLAQVLLDDKTESFYTRSLNTIAFKAHLIPEINHLKATLETRYPFLDSKKQRSISRLCFVVNKTLTPKYMRVIQSALSKPFSFIHVDDNSATGSLNETRAKKIEIVKKAENNELKVEELKSSLSAIREKRDLFPSDYSYIYCSALMKMEEYDELLEYVCEELIADPSKINRYPIRFILESRQHVSNKCSLAFTIILCLVYKYSDLATQEDAAEAVEDFLDDSDVELPSQLESIWATSSIDCKQLFFLSDICSTELMSGLYLIGNNQELLFERIRIISLVSKVRGYKDGSLTKEENLIYERLTRQKISSSHINNKIYINTRALRDARREDYGSILDVYNELDSASLARTVVGSSDIEGEDVNSQTFEELLVSHTFYVLMSDFINDDNFGLARYLSSEIRHGVFESQIRSVFEASMLMTSIGPDGKYERNQYWKDRLSVTFKPMLTQRVDEILKDFSHSIDKTLANANNWFSINSSGGDSKGIFAFNLGEDESQKLKVILKESKNVDAFLISLEDLVWEMVDISIQKLDKLINENLKKDIEVIIDEALINISKLNTELVDLKDSFGQARQAFLEQLPQVMEWFRRAEENAGGQVRLKDAVAVAISHVEGIYSPIDIQVQVNDIDNDMDMDYQQCTDFIRGFVTSLLNAMKYRSNLSNIEIDNLISPKTLELTIKNSISKEQYRHIINNGIVDDFKDNVSTINPEHLTTEGGTGFYKSLSFVRDAFGLEATFRVKVEEDEFHQVFVLPRG
ncbi:hypothetical protein CWE13_07500 [Aliidiomarina shirensis]|uniref:Uncharacterized protein n=1 Tax=Aliidiomarina shirensis TaxID=1048642 RepID=A0A432WVI0_9GAMM|nr:hypothetical protein [Aliidiomarina shirensis]RUO37780.1 hypothetical protein CWE13_07500 [Aliidiomarina shirensis]